MSLRDKLLSKKCPEKLVTIDGDDYLVVGLSRVARAQVFADAPRDDDGKLISAQDVERAFLCKCVCDPETRRPIITEPLLWDEIPAVAADPLVAAIRELNKLTPDDVAEKK